MGVDPAAEEQFGPYLVFERLGVGGMATVHRALERGIEGFERIVALKRLLPHLAEDASFIKSFVREAKLAALLNHNNIVQIFELGRVGIQYFISMEYIDGKDIRAILRHARKVTGPPPVHVTIGLLLQLCDALDFAHSKVDDNGVPLRLVHRDVSPSNVLVTSAGHVKVIDFGIAKAQSQQLRTQTGRVKGKLAYMAPECIAGGKDLDARSDLFAVGVIAHELLTARPLFASRNEYQTLLKVQKGEVTPPSQFNSACPAELDAIVLKTLAKDPDERYPSAADLRDELLQLKFKLGLNTGHRDVAQWLAWAATVEAPSGAFDRQSTTGGVSKVAHQTPTPRPQKRDDDEAVEIAWGGGGDQEPDGPLLLDDVPDVSDKHLAPSPSQYGSNPPSKLDDDDDIPAHTPSHGARQPSRMLPIPAPPPDDDDDAPRSHPAIPPGQRKPASVPPGQRYSGPERRTASPASVPPPGVVDRRQPSAPPSERRQPTGDRRGGDRRIISAGPPDGIERRVGDRRTTSERRAPSPSSPPPSSSSERRNTAQGLPPLRKATATGAFERPSDNEFGIEGRPARSITEQLAANAALESAYEQEDTRPKLPAGVGAGAGVPSTKPGFAPPRNLTRAEAPDLAPKDRPPRPATDIAFGSGIMERQNLGRGRSLVVGLAVTGLVAAGVAYVMTRSKDPSGSAVAPAASSGMASAKHERGTVKFDIEPTDSEIVIEGMDPHVGSPWVTQLPPGVHSIQIQRSGRKAYLTSIELSANETQTLRVVLEPLGSQSTDEATLVLSSSPPGLEAVLDGNLLPQRTPIKMAIRPGPHTIVLRQNGVEVWRQELTAKPSSDYVFNPSMAVDKQRERAQRAQNPVSVTGAAPTPTPTPTRPASIAGSGSESTPGGSAASSTGLAMPTPPTVPPIADPVKPPAPAPSPPPPASTPPPRPAPAPATGAPQLVAPNAVTRVSGAAPSIPKSKRAELPAVIVSRVCIDVRGKVTDVQLMTKVERHTTVELTRAIRGWTYAPYKQRGAAVPVCFVVNFRVADS